MSDLTPYPREAAEREAQAEPPRPAHAYASWGSRVGAYLLDVLILAVPLGLLVVLIAVLASDDGDESTEESLLVLFYLLTVLVPVLYFTLMHGGERGATYGKRALGIRVVDEQGGAIGYGRALGRYAVVFGLGLFGLPLLVDYLWPLWDDQNQTLHDKAVRSLVVRA